MEKASRDSEKVAPTLTHLHDPFHPEYLCTFHLYKSCF